MRIPVQNKNNKSALLITSPQKLLFGLVFFAALLTLVYRTSAIVDADWSEGFYHPLHGWDHLLTMLTVGIWAAQLRGHAVWLLPLAFVGVMSLGGLAGAAGLAIPSVEGLILLSCIVFSILIVRRVRFSTRINVMIVAFFAFFHGFAHGQEISTSASLISYTLGFMLATLLLHGAGIIVAKLVVLSITCLAALFFSSIAQANHPDSVATGKIKNVLMYQDTVSTHLPKKISQNNLDYRKAYHSPAEDYWYLLPHAIPTYDVGNESGSSTHAMTNNGLSNAGKSLSCKIIANNKVTGIMRDLAWKQHVFNPPADFQLTSQIFYSGYLLGCNLDFKQHYPDINHTPGKDLLSNGVGLTSPPETKDSLIVQQIPQPFLKNPVLSFEDFALQIPFAKLTPGNSSLRKKDNLPRKNYVNRNLSKSAEYVHAPKHCQRIFSTALILTKPCNHPSGLAVGVASSLDLLSKKLIKKRSNVAAAVFITT